MTNNGQKMAIYESWIFKKISSKIEKSRNKKKDMFHVVAFDPIRIQTCLAPQNYHQNLCCVKDIHVVGKRMARNGGKIAKHKGYDIWIWTDYSKRSPKG